MPLDQLVAASTLQVGADHLDHHLLEGGLRLPAELGLGLGRVAEQGLDLRRPEIPRIDAHDYLAWL